MYFFILSYITDTNRDLLDYEEASSRKCAQGTREGTGGCLSRLFTPQEAFKFVRLCRHEV